MELSDLNIKFYTAARRKAVEKALGGDIVSDPPRFCALAGSSRSMLIANIAASQPGPMLVAGRDREDAAALYHDISRLMGDEAVELFPSGYSRHIKYATPDAEAQIRRTEALNRYLSDEALKVIVTYPEALAEKVMDRHMADSQTLTLRTGEEHDPEVVTAWLHEHGFTQVDYVYEPGTYARRGSILDIFGYSHELPVRIDFFGDDIDSIRTFNVENQLSERRLETATVSVNISRGDGGGMSLLEFVDNDILIASASLRDLLSDVRATACDTELSQSAAVDIEADTDALQQLVDFDRFEALFAKCRRFEFTAAAKGASDTRTEVAFNCSPQGTYNSNIQLFTEFFDRYAEAGYKAAILSDNASQLARLKELIGGQDGAARFTPVYQTLHEGFVDHTTHMCVFTDHQIYSRYHRCADTDTRARAGRVALSLKELKAIEPGDYIVHVDHGIGRFGGLVRTSVNGTPQEMIKLVYQNDDIIFVSIHALHKLAKYRGKEGVPPKISKLGTGAWNRIKEHTKSKLKDIARDLIRLYAARREKKGYAFSPDSYLQHELEASFIYEDTPDQLEATKAVKADMESSRPMDRLVCGDVGFGKTEIAIRAALKAATDGKQTAVLVPTTVLAYQHYNTFKERLKDFPVRVDYLSRARSAKQTREILADLEAGKIDILIGTHKLIGKTVKFHDLGLLIVDEEQKFGVAVKDKLKQIKVNVDTLTMSATPIPRTLQFSLMGARDLSSITTPPPNRHPIITTVSSLSDDLVAEAVNFELARNGQVFFINNRIEGLYRLEEMIHRVVPDARVAVAHGQMPPEQLEQLIISFAAHEYDVLLSTTIIESGVDMPNVNTIVVNNAQNFGLSELHQLRGRVGRSSRKAFCYLLVPPEVTLTPVARRRLQAIESFSELGSGIHIAMQDLDIRGAGNLLGAEQSGFIADLGYETYQKILKEAVMELRNEEFADEFAEANNAEGSETEYVTDCVIESDLELLLPADYVPQESERIALYQELDGIDRDSDIEAYAGRLRDRFGPIPPSAEELLRVPRIRRIARRLGIEKVALKQGVMYTYFVDDTNIAYYQSPMFGKMLSYLQAHPRRVKIREVNRRRSFAIANVRSTADAVSILDEIMMLPSA